MKIKDNGSISKLFEEDIIVKNYADNDGYA